MSSSELAIGDEVCLVDSPLLTKSLPDFPWMAKVIANKEKLVVVWVMEFNNEQYVRVRHSFRLISAPLSHRLLEKI